MQKGKMKKKGEKRRTTEGLSYETKFSFLGYFKKEKISLTPSDSLLSAHSQ